MTSQWTRFRISAMALLAVIPAFLFVGWASPARAASEVKCESFGGRYTECRLNTDRGVRLKQRLSGAACTRDKTFGIAGSDKVWVSDGCRGVFVAGSLGNSVTCQSQGNRYVECPIRTAYGVRLVKRLSKSQCTAGRHYGVARHGVMWVKGGCRGVFQSGPADRRYAERAPSYQLPGGGPGGGGYGGSPGIQPRQPGWTDPDRGRSPWQNPDEAEDKRTLTYRIGYEHGRIVAYGGDEDRFKRDAVKRLQRVGLKVSDILPGGRYQKPYENGYFKGKSGQ